MGWKKSARGGGSGREGMTNDLGHVRRSHTKPHRTISYGEGCLCGRNKAEVVGARERLWQPRDLAVGGAPHADALRETPIQGLLP